MHQIAVTTDEVPQAAVVSISGEFDMSAVTDVERQIRPIEDRVPVLVVDLRAVSFLDSSALRLVVELDANARTRGDDSSSFADPTRSSVSSGSLGSTIN